MNTKHIYFCSGKLSMCFNPTGAMVNTLVAPPGGYLTISEIEKVLLFLHHPVTLCRCPDVICHCNVTGFIKTQAGGVFPGSRRIFYWSPASFRRNRRAVPQVRPSPLCLHEQRHRLKSSHQFLQVQLPAACGLCGFTWRNPPVHGPARLANKSNILFLL